MKVTRDAQGNVTSTQRTVHTGTRGCLQLFLFFIVVTFVIGAIASVIH